MINDVFRAMSGLLTCPCLPNGYGGTKGVLSVSPKAARLITGLLEGPNGEHGQVSLIHPVLIWKPSLHQPTIIASRGKSLQHSIGCSQVSPSAKDIMASLNRP